MKTTNTIWHISREYAGIAEAGGVKNVVRALARVCADLGFEVTVFLPRYGNIDITEEQLQPLFQKYTIETGFGTYEISLYAYQEQNINFVLVDNEIFRTKKNVYTYSEAEVQDLQASHPSLKKGDGHLDSFEMNLLFQKAILEYALSKNEYPTVLHCHDAHTALLPIFFTTDRRTTDMASTMRKLVTIHNANNSYRQNTKNYTEAQLLSGLTDTVISYGMVDGLFEPFIACAPYAQLTTVSPHYATELEQNAHFLNSPAFCKTLQAKKIHIIGITNGISIQDYNSENKQQSLLPVTFSIKNNNLSGKYHCRDLLLKKTEQNNNAPNLWYQNIQQFGKLEHQHEQKLLYLVYQGRLVSQKGIEILINCIPELVARESRLRFLIMGQGDPALETASANCAQNNAGKCVYFRGYKKELARLLLASGDFIVLPSLFEPCGLQDLVAQLYGTIPIAHAVGGLQKIEDGKTGFLYQSNPESHSQQLSNCILEQAAYFFDSTACVAGEAPYFKAIIANAYKKIEDSFTWKNIIKRYYLPVYFETKHF